jgi:hypothetical protein
MGKPRGRKRSSIGAAHQHCRGALTIKNKKFYSSRALAPEVMNIARFGIGTQGLLNQKKHVYQQMIDRKTLNPRSTKTVFVQN